jgi:hypothetical protein
LKSERVGSRTSITIGGIIDEGADLTGFHDLQGDVVVDLAEIRRINSYGVRLWVDAMRKIPPDARVVFVRCSPPMVEQMNMIHGFFGQGELKSFFAPMICPECEEPENELFEVDSCRDAGGKLPATTCAACGEQMEVDDIESQYLFFLRLDPDEV